MNRIENTSASTATIMSRANRGVCIWRWSIHRHFSCASAEKPYGIAAVIPVIKISVVNTVDPSEPM